MGGLLGWLSAETLKNVKSAMWSAPPGHNKLGWGGTTLLWSLQGFHGACFPVDIELSHASQISNTLAIGHMTNHIKVFHNELLSWPNTRPQMIQAERFYTLNGQNKNGQLTWHYRRCHFTVLRDHLAGLQQTHKFHHDAAESSASPVWSTKRSAEC